MRTLEELIERLEMFGEGCGLISDDAGHWAVSVDGLQNEPTNPPQDVASTFFVEAEQWKPTIREALEYFYEESEDSHD